MLIKPDLEIPADKRHWKTVVSESFRDLEKLLEFCEIDPVHADFQSCRQFIPRVTRYFASLIEKGNHLDPLLLQVLPTADELRVTDGYSMDAVDDRGFMPVPGLIHKYYGRVLLTLTGACAIHCRYCFRRHFSYSEASADLNTDGEVMKYLEMNTEIREVILSGGDPLMLGDEKLAALISSLNQVPHIRVLRIHSRLLSVLPERVSVAFLEVLQRFNGQVVLVTHINHPNEVSAPNQAAFSLLAQQGHRLFNQSVLLRRVNDCVQTLAELSYKLFESQVTPYYLHRLDKVQGAAHFDLSAEESRKLYLELRGCLPGYLLPALVEDIPGQPSKLPLSSD